MSLLLPAVTLDDYTKLTRPTIKWLIPGILPRPGLTVLMGPPFSGKSFFGLQLALDLGSGRSPFGQVLPQAVRVMYLQLDTSELVWRERLEKVRFSGVSLQVPVYMPHPDTCRAPLLITEPAAKLELQAALQEIQPAVVIVDVLRELHQFDENDSTQQKIVFDHIQSVFGDYALVVLHHSKKVVGDISTMDPIMLCRGSSYIPGKADAVWLLAGGKLKIVSRFAEESIWNMDVQKNGLFAISPVGNGSEVAGPDPKLESLRLMLQQKLPGQTPAQFYTIHQEAFEHQSISRSTYFRLLRTEELLPGPNHS